MGTRQTIASNKYKKKTYKRYLLQVRKDTQSDIIEKLESVKSKNAYILSLIKKDLLLK